MLRLTCIFYNLIFILLTWLRQSKLIVEEISVSFRAYGNTYPSSTEQYKKMCIFVSESSKKPKMDPFWAIKTLKSKAGYLKKLWSLDVNVKFKYINIKSMFLPVTSENTFYSDRVKWKIKLSLDSFCERLLY